MYVAVTRIQHGRRFMTSQAAVLAILQREMLQGTCGGLAYALPGLEGGMQGQRRNLPH